ncbi:MAG: hypothetical protein ACYC2K_11480 [Gemmatimonadales bacterium]
MKRIVMVASLLVGVAGCAALQQLAALRNVDFSIASVQNGRLAGIDLARLRDYSSLSTLDAGRVALALSRRELPFEFLVNVRALNPADNTVSARMIRLAWSLHLDDRETISGVLDTTIVLAPGTPGVIPMRMRLDLLEFFDGSAQSLANIALSVAGQQADPAKVSIRAIPTIETPLGPMSYPSPVTIVSRTF